MDTQILWPENYSSSRIGTSTRICGFHLMMEETLRSAQGRAALEHLPSVTLKEVRRDSLHRVFNAPVGEESRNSARVSVIADATMPQRLTRAPGAAEVVDQGITVPQRVIRESENADGLVIRNSSRVLMETRGVVRSNPTRVLMDAAGKNRSNHVRYSMRETEGLMAPDPMMMEAALRCGSSSTLAIQNTQVTVGNTSVMHRRAGGSMNNENATGGGAGVSSITGINGESANANGGAAGVGSNEDDDDAIVEERTRPNVVHEPVPTAQQVHEAATNSATTNLVVQQTSVTQNVEQPTEPAMLPVEREVWADATGDNCDSHEESDDEQPRF
ncbi:hypothetical protein NE237_029068 [Protea cynaroides]|uniref:Uncharacterized protein n=1 Tax=Protea cynaroides TaxID=273540 RepID=A0A9Q0GQH6_9MAGN|nr:hypothetical protein NE237_029068 [Protea cynaroides]